MTRISRKRSGELPEVAAVDLESEIHLVSIESTASATSSALTAFMRQRWSDVLERDPYYNPNLSRERADFSLGK